MHSYHLTQLQMGLRESSKILHREGKFNTAQKDKEAYKGYKMDTQTKDTRWKLQAEAIAYM